MLFYKIGLKRNIIFRIYCTFNIGCNKHRIRSHNLLYYNHNGYITLHRRNKNLCGRFLLSSQNGAVSSNVILQENTSNNLVSRSFSSVDDEADFENIDSIEEKLTSPILRNSLYPDSKDEIIVKLNKCDNVQEVFHIIQSHSTLFNSTHVSQSILVLWDLQKHCRSAILLNEVYLNKDDLVKSFVEQMKNHETFEELMNLLNNTYKDMTIDSLAYSILYLSRFGVSIKSNISQNLITKFEELIDEVLLHEIKTVSLSALSRFILALGTPKFNVDLKEKIALTKLLPYVESWIDNCDNVIDYKLITICIYYLDSVLTCRLFEKYLNLTEKLLDAGQFNLIDGSNIPTIIKATSLISFSTFSMNEFHGKIHKIVNDLLKLLIGNLKHVKYLTQLFILQKIFLFVLEPAKLEVELKQSCRRWIENNEITETELMTDISTELLYCLVANTVTTKQYRFNHIAKRIINETNKLVDLLIITSNHLKPLLMLNRELYPTFLNKLNTSPNLKTLENMLYIGSRYMDTVGSSKRNTTFERDLTKWLLYQLTNSSCITPSSTEISEASSLDMNNNSEFNLYSTVLEPIKLAQIGMLLLSYPEHIVTNYNFSNVNRVTQLLINNMEQFDIMAIHYVSRCFRKVFLHNVYGFSGNSDMIHYLAKLDSAVTNRTLQLLEETPITGMSLHYLNTLFRSFLNRKCNCNSYLFQKIIDRYQHVNMDDISSRSLRNTVYNMNIVMCLLPDLYNKLCDYIVINKDNVVGSTVSKLLNSLFMLNYTPKNKLFFSTSCDILMRSLDNLSGFHLLQASLALAYHNNLNVDLIKHIFTIEFLDQLDDEMKHGYSKSMYPLRIKRCLMELNRSVCLDYPEVDVPWFHKKFCEQEATTYTRHKSRFGNGVYETLLFITKDKNLIQQNVQSPYGHSIEFQLCFDENNEIVPFKKDTVYTSKVAIMLNNECDFTVGERRLIGPHQIHQKHLQMLGYNVFPVDEVQWNSMYMAEPDAKVNYFKDLLSSVAVNLNKFRNSSENI